jgi:hypothetical protein
MDTATAPPADGTARGVYTFTLANHWQGGSVSVGADVRLYLRLIATLLLLWRIGVSVALIVDNRYDFTMYTYWSNTLVVVFYAMLVLGLFVEHWVLPFTTLFVFPLALGSVFLVAISIVIIIQQNEAVFFNCTANSTSEALSLIHTGDWVLHSAPVIEILMLLGVGYVLYVRRIIASELDSIPRSEWRAVYVLYWYLAPLILMLIYSLIFDPATHYPTGIPTYVLWLGLVTIDVVWMTVWYLAFTSSALVKIIVVPIFYRARPRSASAPPALQSGNGSRHMTALDDSRIARSSSSLTHRVGGPFNNDYDELPQQSVSTGSAGGRNVVIGIGSPQSMQAPQRQYFSTNDDDDTTAAAAATAARSGTVSLNL